ncbi:nucleic acid-binding protein [Candidatus Brocadia pituitae]|nr:nucleic acid-binding protein [Candidatus Brocadia pituitae]
MPEIVIVNTSPIYYLHRLDCLDILKKLYGKIIIPQAVVNELEAGKRVGEDVPEIRKYEWMTVKEVNVHAFINIITDLGHGEAEVLALACEERDALVIVDDALARRIAKLRGLRLTGTAGVFLKAKAENHITEINPFLNKMKDIGFYLTGNLISEILRIAGED